MNKTEEKGLNWLIGEGYKRGEIIYKKIPTFITLDDKKFEVKRLYGNQIIFYSSGYNKLKNMKDVNILVFRDHENKPFLRFKFDEIKDRPKYYKEIEINWVGFDQKIKTIRVREKTKLRLQSYGKMGENFDELINNLLDQLER